MNCPNCNMKMIRRKSKFGNNYWWGCPNYPECKITCAEHPGGEIMSLPADKKTKDLRIKAHNLARKIWGKNKDAMYKWMKEHTKSGHFGLMKRKEIRETINKLNLTKNN